MESILGDTAVWCEHLSGAASIIKTTLTQKDDGRVTSGLQQTLEGRWLLRNFAYHDILASVTLSRETLILGLYWMNEEDDVVDTYFGLASLPMAMIAEISSLCGEFSEWRKSHTEAESWSTPSVGGGEEDEQNHTISRTSDKALLIGTRLLEWQPRGAQDRSLVCLAESYRNSALIYLYRTFRYNRQGMAGALNNKIAREVDCL